MVPSGKSLGESPELLQVGELSKTITVSELILPIHRFSQENLTATLNKQDHIYCINFSQGIRRAKRRLEIGLTI